MDYRLKPAKVEAFQFNEDSEITGPEWFGKAIQNETIFIDRIMVDGAICVRGCSIKATEGGWNRAKIGDFVIRSSGKIFTCKKKLFSNYFEAIEREEGKKDGKNSKRNHQ